MTEITFAAGLAKLIQDYGVIGAVIAFAVIFFLYDKRQRQKDDEDRVERKQNTDADRLMWTNHLSAMIKQDTTSRTELAVGLTKLSDAVNNFQSRCGQIQTSLQNEVDRLQKG